MPHMSQKCSQSNLKHVPLWHFNTLQAIPESSRNKNQTLFTWMAGSSTCNQWRSLGFYCGAQRIGEL